MNKYRCLFVLLLLVFTLLVREKASSEILSGAINMGRVISESGVVVDKNTGNPIAGARVGIPAAGTETVTNEFGRFQLDMPKKKPLIMSVKAKGYKPFSLIIDETNSRKPMQIAIEEKSDEIVIDTRLHHLGDNQFSLRSANSGEFSASASGPSYFQEFYLEKPEVKNSVLLKIGSIIGIDTQTAQDLRQSHVIDSASSPVKVYLNSRKLGEICFNGNNHIFRVPVELLREKAYNHVRIETGVNLNSGSRTDYDDIEFINLVLEFQ